MSENLPTPRVRFAPSPTGAMHVGNLRLALINWLFARSQGGNLLLRIDDTDLERSREEYVNAIHEDLTWIGLMWDRTARQSDRIDRYAAAATFLTEQGRLYPCYETQEELSLKRKSQLSRGKPPIYDRAALKLTPDDHQRFLAEGRKPHWRFRLDDGAITWTDMVHGDMKFEAINLSDPVLIKDDGRPIYTLGSVVDDLDFRITHVIRGDDHISNTAIQIQLWQALIPFAGGDVPIFGHLPLLSDANGDKLSKRAGSLSIRDMREAGVLEPMALCSVLAKLGTSDPIEPRSSLDQLVADFNINKFSKAMAKLDDAEFTRITTKLLQEKSFFDMKPRLDAAGLNTIDENFWLAVRANITSFDDIGHWWQVAMGAVDPIIDDADFLIQAATLLPDGAWTTGTWAQWIDRVKGETGRKGKLLFMPIRKALTGMEHGPELAPLLPMIGRDRAVKRLNGLAA
jgi:glutamyl-tRNA synthetase